MQTLQHLQHRHCPHMILRPRFPALPAHPVASARNFRSKTLPCSTNKLWRLQLRVQKVAREMQRAGLQQRPAQLPATALATAVPPPPVPPQSYAQPAAFQLPCAAHSSRRTAAVNASRRPRLSVRPTAAAGAAVGAAHQAQATLLGHSTWGEGLVCSALQVLPAEASARSATLMIMQHSTGCAVGSLLDHQLWRFAGIWAALAAAGCAGLWCEQTKWGKEMSGALLR